MINRKPQINSSGPAYVSWSPKSISQYSNTLQELRPIQQVSRGRWNQDLSNLSTNTSGYPGLSKRDYYAFRPEEAPSTSYKHIISDAEIAYQTVGIIRNIIDLMADFACQGIRVVHPNKRIEKFYQNWFSRVNGKERSERFLNNLYRTGNIIIKTQTAKLKIKQEKDIYKAVAADTEISELSIVKKEIPWKYTFLNPQYVDVVGGALSSFVGKPLYALKLPADITRKIKAPNKNEKDIVNQLPQEIKDAATKGSIILDPNKTDVYHYKKDDWQTWANPMIYAIMDSIQMLEKLQLADMAALDGAISNLRIFKIGSLEYKIAPQPAAAAKLAELLECNTGGGSQSFIWGPDIELLESKTTVHQFLGEEKYKPHLNAIYGGLGIPATLTGTSGSGGTTNNLISLKTLTSRLSYGRDILLGFWNKQLAKVQKAMGFRFPAKVEFTFQNLGDETAEKALLIQLADRELISDELIQTLFGHDSEMEQIRLNREDKERHDGKRVQKASPYYDPQFGQALKKIALQQGIVTPSQVGLSPNTRVSELLLYDNEGETPAITLNKNDTSDKKSGQVSPGRPKNAKDKQKRKKPAFTPRTRAAIELWAKYAHEDIGNILHKEVLKSFGKDNLRKLSQTEADSYEQIKFGVLCNLMPFSNVTDEVVADCLVKKVPPEVYNTYRTWASKISHTLSRKLTLDELKQIQASIYTLYAGDKYGEISSKL
jgi:hypothetical protein